MKDKITIRIQRVSDAKRFFEILNNPNFVYFSVCPKSIEEERKILRKNIAKIDQKIEWSYSILFNGVVIGAVGLRKHGIRGHVGEIGYFVEEKYWGKGVASRAVELITEVAVKELGFRRLEIIARPENKGSVRVAEKCGFEKEGLCRKLIATRDGKFHGAYLYAKVF